MNKIICSILCLTAGSVSLLLGNMLLLEAVKERKRDKEDLAAAIEAAKGGFVDLEKERRDRLMNDEPWPLAELIKKQEV